MPFPSNTPTVDDLPGIGLQDFAVLPIELLAILHREVDERLKCCKAAKARLDGALEVRFAARAAEERQTQAKDTGTVRFQDGEVTVVSHRDYAQLMGHGGAAPMPGYGQTPAASVPQQGYAAPAQGYTAPAPRQQTPQTPPTPGFSGRPSWAE